ncbi:MAG: hypothetical protein EA377_00275, partial [Phycisphaerales bacterium]
MPRCLHTRIQTTLLVVTLISLLALLLATIPSLRSSAQAASPWWEIGAADAEQTENDREDENDTDAPKTADEALPKELLPDDSDESDAEPERVILRVSRHRELSGHVEMEDQNVIVIRTLRGELESFHKTRINQIVRLVNPDPGQRGVVIMRSGQAREGVIIEDNFDDVVMEIEGIRVRIDREHVDYVRLEPTFEDLYRRFLDALDPGRHDQHITLVQWLIEQRQYELARGHLEHLEDVVDEDRITSVRRLRTMVDAQLELIREANERSGKEERERVSARSDRDRARRSPTPAEGQRLLTREEVNLIRVYELDFDRPPRLRVSRETIHELIDRYGTSPLIPSTPSERNRLFRADPERVVRLMFELRARDLYPQIEVQGDPESMNVFRQRIHNTWLMNNCATSGCHGGPNETRFMLHRENHRSERTRYTNFLILERLEIKPRWPMINYEQPELSLIVQYGLPREWARLPHPDVPGWKPVFTRRDDSMKRDAVEWIQMMMQPRPEYPIEFDPNPAD